LCEAVKVGKMSVELSLCSPGIIMLVG